MRSHGSSISSGVHPGYQPSRKTSTGTISAIGSLPPVQTANEDAGTVPVDVTRGRPFDTGRHLTVDEAVLVPTTADGLGAEAGRPVVGHVPGDRGVGRIRAGLVAAERGQEVVAGQREEVEVGRRPHRSRCGARRAARRSPRRRHRGRRSRGGGRPPSPRRSRRRRRRRDRPAGPAGRRSRPRGRPRDAGGTRGARSPGRAGGPAATWPGGPGSRRRGRPAGRRARAGVASATRPATGGGGR